MDIIYSPSGIVDFKHPVQGFTDISNAGFQNISLDISLCCSGNDLESFEEKEKNSLPKSYGRVTSLRTPEAMERHLEPFLTQCHNRALSIRLIRLSRLPWDTKRTDLNPLLEQIAESAIHLCRKIGCPHLIVPPLFSGIEKDMEWIVNRDYYLRLASTAREQHVTLLLENQCRSYNGHLIRGVCSDSAQAAEWVDQLNKEEARQIRKTGTDTARQVGQPGSDSTSQIQSCPDSIGQPSQADPVPPIFAFCLDTGACTLCGQDMHEFASTLGSRLQVVLLRDCGRQQESSLLPFTAAYQGQPQTDWLSLIRGLRSIDFNGSLLMDFEDTVSAFSPLLRPRLLPLARTVAEYFKWQVELESLLKKYDSIVLFGAGNMCRNYMKCYGQQYPPLFTCDNNQAVWGTQFCGLEVKPPEALKEIPDNCGIFICNIYYREIEKQLMDMGIRNIEFFNDEYMPSFHLDRLEV